MTQSMDICPQIAGSKGAAASPPPASRMLLYMNVPGQLRFIVNGRLSSDSRLEKGGGSIPVPGLTHVMNVPGQLRFIVNETVNGRLSSNSRIERSCVKLFNKAGFITVQQQAVKPCYISLIDLCYRGGFFSNLLNYE